MTGSTCSYCYFPFGLTSITGAENTPGKMEGGKEVATGVGAITKTHYTCTHCGAKTDVTAEVVAIPSRKNYTSNKPSR